VAGLTTAQANFGTTNTQTFCVGTNDLTELKQLQDQWIVYPNPTESTLTIALTSMNGNKAVIITTAAGQIVRTLSSNDAQANFEVTGLAKGVYFVTLTTVNGTSTKTFVVK
jgi:hypothetical protein